MEYDEKNNDGAWRTYIRIKVCLDVRQLLKKVKKVKKLRGGWRVVNFIYKRLGVFCFLCGTQKKSAKGVLSLMMTMEKEGEAQKSG